MKKFIVVTLLTLSTISLFSACDKPDYQDPRYRSTH